MSIHAPVYVLRRRFGDGSDAGIRPAGPCGREVVGHRRVELQHHRRPLPSRRVLGWTCIGSRRAGRRRGGRSGRNRRRARAALQGRSGEGVGVELPALDRDSLCRTPAPSTRAGDDRPLRACCESLRRQARAAAASTRAAAACSWSPSPSSGSVAVFPRRPTPKPSGSCWRTDDTPPRRCPRIVGMWMPTSIPIRVLPGRCTRRSDASWIRSTSSIPSCSGSHAAKAMGMDPQQRLVLEVTGEAFKGAGWCPGSRRQRHRRVRRSCHDDYIATEHQLGRCRPHRLLHPDRQHLQRESGRIAYTFGLQGPRVPIDTARGLWSRCTTRARSLARARARWRWRAAST